MGSTVGASQPQCTGGLRMSRICIAYDRMRVEEKMLQKAINSTTHQGMTIDVKAASASTTNVPDVGDVVLERCVSYYRGLHFTACLESADIPVVNRFEVASLCGNKMFVSLRLQKEGVPTPHTMFAFSGEGALQSLERHGYPRVIKPVVGSWGRGVMPLRDRDAADALLEVRAVTDTPLDRIYYLQDMVSRPPRDIRVVTVGGRPVAAMYRTTEGFRTNVAAGGAVKPCRHDGEIGEAAARASDAVGGGILGIDMMEDDTRGLLVHEINNTVEFRGISTVSDTDIAAEMIQYALREAHR